MLKLIRERLVSFGQRQKFWKRGERDANKYSGGCWIGLGWVGLDWVGEQSLVAVLDRDRSFGKDANKYSGGWHN